METVEILIVPYIEGDPYPPSDADIADFRAQLEKAGLDFAEVEKASRTPAAWELSGFAIAIGPALIAAVAGVCVAWVRAKLRRKVSLKVGNIRAEGNNVKEIERLFRQAMAFQESDNKRIAKPDTKKGARAKTKFKKTKPKKTKAKSKTKAKARA